MSQKVEFHRDDVDGVMRAVDDIGFCVVKQVLTPALNEALQASVRETLMPGGVMPEGKTNIYNTTFIEKSPPLLGLLRYRPHMKLAEALAGGTDLTIHRSAAIVRVPGDNGMSWHSDYQFDRREPAGASEYLNTTVPAGRTPSMWYYLTGCSPEEGGIAVVPGSHRLDWQPGEGIELSADRRRIHRVGEKNPSLDMGIPGAVPVRAEPGDLVVFGLVTYHGVYAHRGQTTRLSCGFGFRRRGLAFKAPWPLTPEAKAFVDSAPEDLKPYVEGYVGLDHAWKPEAKKETAEVR